MLYEFQSYHLVPEEPPQAENANITAHKPARHLHYNSTCQCCGRHYQDIAKSKQLKSKFLARTDQFISACEDMLNNATNDQIREQATLIIRNVEQFQLIIEQREIEH